ncbi:MAG TPA: M56 family metallopeptidase [Tepidisphaeraceae bacterium]|jgi:beta-lactamase regulating signal transducer with metallopeptidase domain
MYPLLNHILGNTAIALLLAILATSAMRLRHPALAHALWLLVLLKFLTPPIWNITVPWIRESPLTPAVAPIADLPPVITPRSASASVLPDDFNPTAPLPPPTAPRHTDFSLPSPPLIVAGLWLTGSCAWIVLLLIRVKRFRRLMLSASPAEQALQSQVEKLCGEIGLRRVPQTLLLSATVSPMLWVAGGRAKLLLPGRLIGQLNEQQVRSLIMHELAHLARRDHWCRIIEMLATGVYWWHPLLWWARRRMREAEELCCDAWVVWAMPEARRSYADALVDTLDLLAGSRRSALTAVPNTSGLGQLQDLQRRLTMIFSNDPPRRQMSRLGLGAMLVLATLLPLMPVLAQQQQPARPNETVPSAPAVASPPTTQAVVDALLEAAQDSDQNVVAAAMGSLVRMGESAAPALVKAMGNREQATLATQAMQQIGMAGAPALIGGMSSPDPLIRRMSIETLIPMFAQPSVAAFPGGGYGAPGVVRGMPGQAVGAPPPSEPEMNFLEQIARPALKAAADEDVTVRRAAVTLLGCLPPQAVLIAPALVDALRDKDDVVRERAAQALGPVTNRLPPDSKEIAGAIQGLAAAIGDAETPVRLAAVNALCQLGPMARPALPQLMRALKDRNGTVRSAAAQAIGLIQLQPPPAGTAEEGMGAQPVVPGQK